MANQEQLDRLLNEGVEAWNEWRRSSNDEIDLTKATLCGLELKRANLKAADLTEADLSMADLEQATLMEAHLVNAHLVRTNFTEAKLESIVFTGAEATGAKLIRANLIGADFTGANFLGANFTGAKLLGADFTGADLTGVKLLGASIAKATLNGLKANYSVVDSETYIRFVTLDNKTDFTGTGLDSACIDPELKAKLKRNIRRLHWTRRYRKQLWTNILRPFWWASDYGSSSSRLIFSFVGLTLLFTAIYLAPERGWDGDKFAHPFIQGLNSYESADGNLIQYSSIELTARALYFSVVTMTTLGFGDMHAHPASMTGQFLVMIQVIVGYVMLGALITRLSILFQEVS